MTHPQREPEQPMINNQIIAALFGDIGSSLTPPSLPGGSLIELTLQELAEIQEQPEFIALRNARDAGEIDTEKFRANVFELMNRVHQRNQPLSQD